MREKVQNLHERLCNKYAENNRIFSVLFEITHRCPCNCKHCFLLKPPRNELSLAEIKDLFRQLADEGVIELALSGGEVFIRKDFPEILAAAAARGFILNVLTTGISIGRKEADLLKKCGCRNIELSLLGATPETHDGIMRHPGAFRALLKAITYLKETGIVIALKSTIMEENYRELDAMASLSRDLGAYYSASLSLSPREDGDTAPQKLAISEDHIAHLNPEHLDGAMIPLETKEIQANFVCRAGSTIAGISPEGDIFPCILLRQTVGNIRSQTLQEIWHLSPHRLLQTLRTMKSEDVSECMDCEYKNSCPRCPGVVFMETGSLTSAAPSACTIARALQNLLKDNN